MDETHRKRMSVRFLVSLLVFCVRLTLVPSDGLADDGKSLADTAGGPEEDTALQDEALQLEAVIAYTREHNPALRAARSRLLAAQQVRPQVAAYADPMVMWENWNSPENLHLNEADNNIFRLSQKIPFPGKLRLKGEIAAKEVGQREAELGATEIDTIAQLKKAYYELWLGHQTLNVYRQDQGLMTQFAQIAERKYAVGQVSQPDVLRAQVELTRLINRVTTETLKLSKAQAQLNAVLSRSPEAPLGIPHDPPPPVLAYSLEDLIKQTLAHRPDLMAQAHMVERENLALTLARKAYYPDFEVSVSRFVNFGQRDGFGLTLSASIPLAFKYKYDAGVEEAVANQETAQSELRRLQDRALFEVKQAWVEAQVALEQRTLFLRTHIPQAEQTLAASQISYQTGNIDFLSLIDSVRAVEQVHLEHLMATANFEKAWAELERAVGQELPRKET